VRWDRRVPARRFVVWALLAVSGLVNCLGAGLTWVRWASGVQAVVAVLFVLAHRRVRLSVHDGGVILRDLTRTTAARWDEITAVRRGTPGAVWLDRRDADALPIWHWPAAEMSERLRSELEAARARGA
jgi:hypothetical protein